jgi:hypothetical protein
MAKRAYNKSTNHSSKNGDKFVYKVEHGIEVTGVRLSGLRDKFPFEIMKPGDSFLIPSKDPVAKKPNTLHYAAKQFARIKPGFALTSRMQLNGERRVWRIK